MGNDGIYAVNATILSTDPLRLVEISLDEWEDIANFFHVLAKDIDAGEWYLKINRSEVRSSEHPLAKRIVEAVFSIGSFLSKEIGDPESEVEIREEVWELTWVW